MPDFGQFLRRHVHLVLGWPILALVLICAGWYLLLVQLDRERNEIERSSLREVALLSQGYADQLSRTLQLIDQLLMHVRYEWETSQGNLRLEDLTHKGLFPPTSAVRVVAIVDRDGRRLTDSHDIAGDGTTVFLNERPFFQALKSVPEDVLYIGEDAPGLSKVNLVRFARKLTSRNGEFDGVVMIAVLPEFLTAHYDAALLGKHGFLGIVGADGIVRVTRIGQTIHPPDAHALHSVPRFESRNGNSFFDGVRWFGDKRSRYVGWNAVDQFPLIALTGLDVEDRLAPYLANRAASIRNTIWLTAIVSLLGCGAMVLSLRLAWRKHQVSIMQAAYRMATESGVEGFYIVRAVPDRTSLITDFEIIDCNQRGAELLGEEAQNIVGKRLSRFYSSHGLFSLLEGLRLATKVGFYESDIHVPLTALGNGAWLHIKAIRSANTVAVTLRDVSESKAHVAELERRSNEDMLTGLPNRHWIHHNLPRFLEQAAEKQTMLALLFVDLDGFKAINDTIGHAAGDELLHTVAKRLMQAVRPQDTVARIGGDEFIVIVADVCERNDAAHVALRILDAFDEGFKLSYGVRSIGASIGISVFPDDGTNAATLLQNADVAMYSVKMTGKGKYRFFEPNFHEALRARVEGELALRHAIEHDQFLMYYQPRVDIQTGKSCSMEALVRWGHPTKGLLGPNSFVPLAEETGLILRLGEIVIDKVCTQLAFWKEHGQTVIPVSINVSPRQFNELDIPRIFADALKKYDLDSALVEIEITESSLMGEGSEMPTMLTSLQNMGIKLCIDDFGTGYSSLSQLQRLDFDVLKVDRAFTCEIDRTEQGKVFFTAIVTMAHALGMRVVAEGVENENQINVLRTLHCDEIQGFYISEPLPADQTQHVLSNWVLPTMA